MEQLLTDLQELTEPQRAVLELVASDTELVATFYLTGGTLLKALGIVPRQSNDLDFFSFHTVEPHRYTDQSARVGTLLRALFGSGQMTETTQGFLHDSSGMIIDVVADSSRNIDDFIQYGTLKTASLKDLAAHKASALVSRDEIKDYVDIALLTEHQGWSLADLASFAERKFGLGTISEEKLLTELLSKRDTLSLDPAMFLRQPDLYVKRVHDQVIRLLEGTTL